MNDTIETVRFTAKTLQWAAVEGKHHEMHYLHTVAILGTRALMEHVGIDKEASTKFESTYITDKTITQLVEKGFRDEVRKTQLIPLGKTAVSNELGLDFEFAAIEENIKTDFTNTYSRAWLRHTLARKRESRSLESSINWERMQHTIRRFIGNYPTDPTTTVEIPGSLSMTDGTDLDARFFRLWTPQDMTDRYKRHIDQISTFMDGIRELAETTDFYMPPHHISRQLEENQKLQ